MQVVNTIAVMFALLSMAGSHVWASGPATCNVELTRQDAIQLLAEGAVRARRNLSIESPVDAKEVQAAKRRISARLESGWELEVKQADGCTAIVSYKDPKRWGGGFSIRTDEKKRVIDVLQHR